MTIAPTAHTTPRSDNRAQFAPRAILLAGDALGWPAGTTSAQAVRTRTPLSLDNLAADLEDLACCTGTVVGLLSYDLAHAVEPAVLGPARPSEWPPAVLHAVETTDPTPPDADPDGPFDLRIINNTRPDDPAGRQRYIHAVARTIEYIRAGDIYQANIACPLELEADAPMRTVARTLLARVPARFAGYLELPEPESRPPRRAVCSISPELGIDADFTTGRIVSRPIKGTRPAGADPSELLHAEKDRAELDMIIDLMRNDLGRVCAPGTVRVEDRRSIERHPGVLHAVATVAGTMRERTTPTDVIRAAFPLGSITGAPKVRAMQIIRELEPFPRGPYCGSILRYRAIENAAPAQADRLTLSVAIRTATLEEFDADTPTGKRTRITYPVGAGIVADSDPEAEWLETRHKAAAFLAALNLDPRTVA